MGLQFEQFSHPGPSFERPGPQTFCRKANFKIKTFWIAAQFLAHKPVNFAFLTDSFSVSFLKLLKCKHGKHKKAFRDRNVTGTFEKRAPNKRYKTRKQFILEK